MRLWLVVTAALTLPCVRASAQLAQYDPHYAPDDSGPTPDHDADIGPLSIRAGGILVLPMGATSERFDPGGGFAVGLTLFGDGAAALQLDYVYSRYGLRDDALDLLSLDGHHGLQAFTAGLALRPTFGTPFGLYFVAGPGVYHRNVTITSAAPDGDGRYCDALLFFCFPTEVPASQAIGSESSVDFGIHGGAGLYWMLATPLRLYFEARYHYVWGPEFRSFDGRMVDSDAGYFPLVLGLAY